MHISEYITVQGIILCKYSTSKYRSFKDVLTSSNSFFYDTYMRTPIPLSKGREFTKYLYNFGMNNSIKLGGSKFISLEKIKVKSSMN